MQTQQDLPAGAGGEHRASGTSEVHGIFYGQLAGLLKAGMPMPQALRTLAADAHSRGFREALDRAAGSIEGGAPPEEAFRLEEKRLGGMLGRIAATAAASGRLAALLAELSAWSLHQDRLRRRLVDALSYPTMVLFLTSILSVTGLSFLRWYGWYEGFDGLYAEGAWAVAPSGVEVTAWIVSVGILISALTFMFLGYLTRISPAARRFRERLLIRMPVAGAVCQPLALSRFCGAVSLLLKADVPFHDAVAAGGGLTGFDPYEKATQDAAHALASGRPQSEAWSNRRLFPESLRFILSSAESRGDLPEAFADLAELYRVEAEGRGQLVALLAPPACFVAVAGMVGLAIGTLIGTLIHFMTLLGGI